MNIPKKRKKCIKMSKVPRKWPWSKHFSQMEEGNTPACWFKASQQGCEAGRSKGVGKKKNESVSGITHTPHWGKNWTHLKKKKKFPSTLAHWGKKIEKKWKGKTITPPLPPLRWPWSHDGASLQGQLFFKTKQRGEENQEPFFPQLDVKQRRPPPPTPPNATPPGYETKN